MADQLPHAPAKSLPFCYYSRIAGHPIRERMHEVRTAVCLVCRLVYAAKQNHQLAGIEEVDRGTSLALRYMKQLVERGAVTPKLERLVATAV